MKTVKYSLRSCTALVGSRRSLANVIRLFIAN
jgi:hypothetical protein